MSSSFPPESDLAPFTPWGVATGEPLSTFLQWCEYAEDGVTIVPYPIPEGQRIELSVTWEGGQILLSTDPGAGVTVQDQSDSNWAGFFLVEITQEQLSAVPRDRPVLYRFRSTYEGTPMTILRGEIYFDREAA